MSRVNSPADPPARRFFHDGTEYVVRGDTEMAGEHFGAIRAHLHQLKRNNVNKLPILTGLKTFTDGTTAHYSLVHGREEVQVFSPLYTVTGGEVSEKRTMKTERLVPCFIVTKGEPFSEEIIGYIACMSGSFLGPYQWFPLPESDGEAVLEAFYPEGYDGYIADLAFKHDRKLSSLNDIEKTTLHFFKPSGTAPDDSRLTQGDEYGGWQESVSCSNDPVWQDESDSEWTWSNGTSDATVQIVGSPAGWPVLFDGEQIGIRETILSGGGTAVKERALCACLLEDEPECSISDCKAFYMGEPWDCPDALAVGWDTNTIEVLTIEDPLESSPNYTIRLNDTLSASAVLLTSMVTTTYAHEWKTVDLPTPYDWGSLYSPHQTDSSETWTRELFAVVDQGDRQSVTSAFGWSMQNRYKATGYGNNLVYHKSTTNSITLAAVIAGADIPSGMVYTDMGFVYLGPAAEGLQGSVSFPIISDSIDRYIEPPATLPDGVTGLVRGDVFLGVIKKTKELL